MNKDTCSNCQNKDYANAFIIGTAVGAFLGAVAGLLLSPASGEQNRKQIVKVAKRGRDMAEDFYEDAQDRYQDLREDVEDYVHNIEKKVQPLRKQVSKYAAGALENAEDALKDTRKKFFKGVKL
jgi:gas vesicle protein